MCEYRYEMLQSKEKRLKREQLGGQMSVSLATAEELLRTCSISGAYGSQAMDMRAAMMLPLKMGPVVSGHQGLQCRTHR